MSKADLQFLLDHCGFTQEVLPHPAPGSEVWRIRNRFGVTWGDFVVRQQPARGHARTAHHIVRAAASA